MLKIVSDLPLNEAARIASRLCLACGMCCNGVIFANVRLQPPDEPGRLRSLGLQLRAIPGRLPASGSPPGLAAGPRVKFSQPCRAWGPGGCGIYAERPRYCLEFECLLFKRVRTGRTQLEAALEIIRVTREQAEQVDKLLRELGDTHGHLPLAARFRRTARRMEQQGLSEERADIFGRLTLAFHDLNLQLREAFYPGTS